MNMTAIRNLASGRLALAMTAAAAALALACGLCPGTASADQLQAGQVGAQDSALSTQAATKTVYVITSTTETANWGIESKVTSKYTYNKNGLMTKWASTSNMDGKTTTSYTYNGTVLKGKKKTNGDYTETVTYTANKNGKITKAVDVSLQPYAKIKRTFTAKYKSGKVNKISWKTVLNDESPTNDAYTYKYKNGRVVLRTWDNSKVAYAYDSKGNLNSIGGSKYKNTYNAKKQLTKTSQSATGYKYSKTYKYKAIKVKASVADKVQAQQWALINKNLNFALGIDSL